MRPKNQLGSFSAPDSVLTEWDFSLPIGSRPNQGFVGLKNACATCYMNSVLQQLFMIKPIRTALLAVKIPPEYGEDEFDEDDVRRETVCDCYFLQITRDSEFVLVGWKHRLQVVHKRQISHCLARKK